MTDDYAPELAIPIPDPVGRCYRKPGSKPLEYSDEGKLKLPPKKKYYEFLEAGIWVPSITNIIGLRNRPYLQGWAAKLAVEEAIEIEKKWPGYLLKKRYSAVKYLKQAGDRNRDAAGLQGSIVHDMLEKYALGEEVTPLPEFVGFLDSWKRWCDDYQPEFLQLETTVFGVDDHGNGYAGTADFVAKIAGLTVVGDYKTNRSGLHSEVGLQLSAIAHAQEMAVNDELVPNLDIDAGIAVHVSKDQYQVQPVQLDGMSWESFQGFRSAWMYHVFDGEQYDEGRVLEKPIVSPGQIADYKRKNVI